MSETPLLESDREARTLVDALLEEQRSLTAVERFSRAHQSEVSPHQARFYRDLIPLTAPAPGQQYAFEVDLDKCSGCKACVTACHALNGLDEEETWRDVGLLHSDDWRAPFQRHVTTACHHCVDPGCLNGCPVLAYDKDPVTGIVRHLDDQCIGCHYCEMKCPYDVPKYSAKRGIVRKCDMCSSRLGQGEAPACVQACPSQAIRITLVDQQAVTRQFRKSAEAFLPTAPAPGYTVPTTRYKSAQLLPAKLLAGDHARVSPAAPHMSLVFMLVFTQLAVGAAIAATLFQPANWLAVVAAGFGALGMVCGTLHLGQPLKAWRAFLGWRTSWFSREVIAFAVFLPLAALNALSYQATASSGGHNTLAALTATAGLFVIFCSAMIYADTRREFWRASQCFGKFLGTTALLGSAAALVTNGVNSMLIAALIGLVTAAKLAFEHQIFRHLVDEETLAPSPLNKSARLLAGELGLIARLRIVCGIVGGVILPLTFMLRLSPGGSTEIIFSLAIFVLCLVSELLERFLFFAAVAPAKMPGGPIA
jgi:Fe-S-cluster-containing dehydrogenase component/DMSO reductase anchor subunit